MTKRCNHGECRSECLPLWVVALIVIIVSTLALLFPLIDTLGFAPNSGLFFGITPSGPAVGLVLVWVLAVLVGCRRKHESEFGCIIDSFGVPGFFGSAIFFSKGLGIHF
jgi:uncharacterized membrane protein YczE